MVGKGQGRGAGRLAISQANECVSKKTGQRLNMYIVAHWDNRYLAKFNAKY
jgi:hypothetical protein